MKKLLLLLLFLPFSLFSQSTVYTYTDPTTDTEIRLEHDNLEWELDKYPSPLSNSGSAMIGKKINGKRDGVWRRYWSNGNVRHEETYQNGMDRGRYRYYWENGALSSEGFYWDGMDVSLETYYQYAIEEAVTDKDISALELEMQKIQNEYLSDTSRLFEFHDDLLYYNNVLFTGVYSLHDKEFAYVDGYKHGRSIYYYTSREKGDVYADENWKNGLKDGQWKIYGDDGVLWNIESWKDGKKDGIWESYFSEDSLKFIQNWSNGEQDGLTIYYNNNQTIWREIYFIDGLDTTLIDYFYGKDDKLIRKETRNRDEFLDKYALWSTRRLDYNTIETFHKLYDCKGVFCNKKKHYEYILNINSDECFDSEYFLQCEYYKITEYELFLSKHKNHKFSDKVRQDLLNLKEERDYKLAKNINTIDGYNTFVSLYPNSKKNKEGYNDGTLERIILIDLIKQYNSILNLNSVSAWEAFLSEYPTNCNICMSDRVYEDAKYYLSFSKDLNAWAKATDEGSYESYSEYLVNFIPLRYNGPNREIALARIDSLVEPEWEKIKKKNSIISYREFIERYPNSSYIDLAYEAAWKKAQDKDRINYYNRYLDNLPDAKYVNEALKKKMELEINERERKGLASGKLPTTEEIFDYNIDPNEHHFTIINMTADLGRKSGTKIQATYEASTDQGFKKGTIDISKNECEEIVLIPGSYYFVVIDKSDKSVTPYYGTYECSGGHRSNPLGLYISDSKKYTFNGQTIDFSLPEVPLTLEQKKVLFKKYENCYE